MIESRVDPIGWLGLVDWLALRMGARRPVRDSWEFSDGCVALMRCCMDYDADKGDLQSYICKSVRLHILRCRKLRLGLGVHGRKNWRPTKHLQNMALVLCAKDPDQDAVEAKLDVENALRKFGSSDRAMLYLRYADEARLSDIGRRLGVSRETVRLRVRRLVNQLKRRLDYDH